MQTPREHKLYIINLIGTSISMSKLKTDRSVLGGNVKLQLVRGRRPFKLNVVELPELASFVRISENYLREFSPHTYKVLGPVTVPA